MIPWLTSLALAIGITALLQARLRPWAFRRGWFERSAETDRRRGERRPTHGGVVVGAAVAGGSLLAAGEPAGRAVLLATTLSIAVAPLVDRRKGPAWVVTASRAAASLAVPLAGCRAELTGRAAVDVVLTALGVAAVIVGVAALERIEGAASAVCGVIALGLLVVGERVGDPTRPVAAAVTGASLASLAFTGRPAVLRLGRSGPTVLGTALAAAAIGVQPAVAAPASAAVPVLALLVPGLCATLPGLAHRLAGRGLPVVAILAILSTATVIAADGVGAGSVEPLSVAPIIALLTAATVLLGFTGRRPDSAPPVGRLRWGICGALVVVGVGAGIPAALAARSARSEMLDGRAAAEVGLRAARDGDLDAAVAAFDQARSSFDQARDRLDLPLLRLADVIPGAAQNAHAARDLASIGADLASTAADVATRAGADDLRLTDGVFPIAAAAEVGQRLSEARSSLRTSSERLGDLRSPWLLDDVDDAATGLVEAIADADGSIEVAAEATRLLPQLLGAGTERRWFIGAISSAELRGAGGVLGDYALATASNGGLTLDRTAGASELNSATDDLAMASVLPPVYGDVYAGWQPQRFWQNLTATPDFPTVGSAIHQAYPLAGDGEVEGVVGIDPIGLVGLLELTGPITVEAWPDEISAENALEVLAFENYNVLAPAQIDEFQGQVLRAVVGALSTGSLPTPSRLAATLAPAVAGGHLRFWSPDPEEQALFELIGADGAAIDGQPVDHLTLVTQNSSEAKIDWFLRRSLTYDVDYDPTSGASSARATVTLTNGAPAEGLADYVIGGGRGSPTEAGQNRLSVALLSSLPAVAVLDDAGLPVAASVATERGLHLTTVHLVLEPGATTTLVFELEGRLPPGPSYRLALGQQPTLFPDEVQVTFRGDSRTFEGSSARSVTFDVG